MFDIVDKKLKLLYINLIASQTIEKDDIPTCTEWINNSFYKLSWNYYLQYIEDSDAFTQQILINNDFYKYMTYLSSKY